MSKIIKVKENAVVYIIRNEELLEYTKESEQLNSSDFLFSLSNSIQESNPQIEQMLEVNQLKINTPGHFLIINNLEDYSSLLHEKIMGIIALDDAIINSTGCFSEILEHFLTLIRKNMPKLYFHYRITNFEELGVNSNNKNNIEFLISALDIYD